MQEEFSALEVYIALDLLYGALNHRVQESKSPGGEAVDRAWIDSHIVIVG